LKRAVVALLVIGAGLTALTWWALESGGVAVVQTRTADGGRRDTHVWFVTPGGETWLEAGTPENPWFRDLEHSPLLTLSVEGRTVRYRAEPDPASRERLRSWLREKYGIRDWWVGHFIDSSRSIPVRLVPAGLSPAAGS